MPVIDYEPAQGANGLWASPSGRYLAAELVFAGDQAPAVVKVIERSSGRVVARARGTVVAGPDDEAEVIYAESTGAAQPRLRSTRRADFAIPLPAAPFSQWTGHRLGAGLALVLRRDPKGLALLVVRLTDGELVAQRLSLDGMLAASASPVTGLAYLSVKSPGVHGGAIVALDATLKERWRAAWPAGHRFDAHPTLAVTGDGKYVAATAPSGLLTVDALLGLHAEVRPFDGLTCVELAGVPGRSLLVALRARVRAPESPSSLIEVIDLASDARRRLTPERNGNPPGAIVVTDGRVLSAPGSPIRWYGEPTTWGPELDGFVAP